MNIKAKKLVSTLVLIRLLAPNAAMAAFEDVGIGARVTGLGGAYTAVADDVYASYYNPAGLATLSRPEVATTYSKLLTGLSDSSNLQNSFLAYAHPLQDGRQGTLGLAWNYFTLDSLYRESTVFGSYARPLFTSELPDKLYAGASLKLLNRSIGSNSAASQPLGPTGQVVVGANDPVLQKGAQNDMDADIGVLYRVRPRWTAGLSVQHLLEPNIAFAGEDKLGRNVRLGGAYKTPFSTLAADLDFMRAPDGKTDKVFALATEKWLPTLVYGTFGVRGSLGLGDRSYRQLAIGLSYKIHRMQFDYGFSMPLAGISGTAGSHRLGLTLRFGRVKEAQPTIGEAILENMRDLAQTSTPEFRYQMEDLALYKRTAIEEFLRQTRLDVSSGKFADALEKLDQAASLKPGDAKIGASRERLKLVADVYPEVRDYGTDAAQAALYEGALDFLAGRDAEALKKLAYAQTLNPKDEKLETMLQVVETKAGVARAGVVPARTAPTLGAEKLVGGTMALMEVALQEREYDKVLKLAAQVLELDPSNALAYKRMGAAYYALKRYPESLRALRSAYKLETDAEQKRTLKSYIDALTALIQRKSSETAAKPLEQTGPKKTPQDIERLYEAGVDLYAQGRLAEAAAAFRKMLDLDPTNLSARRALDRVQAEILQNSNEKR